MALETASAPETGPNSSQSLADAEFRALRETIRERGSLRHLTTLITFSVWAATMLWAAGTVAVPVFMLVPLVALVAGFEIGFSLHVGVERVGRYLQVRYEAESATLVAWERTAMALRVPGGGIDPLFFNLYAGAAILNLLGGIWVSPLARFAPDSQVGALELGIFGILHVAAVARWLTARRFARAQRERDLAAMREVLKDPNGNIQTVGVRNPAERQD